MNAHDRIRDTRHAWRCRLAPRHKARVWQVVDGYRDPVAVVYCEKDARLIAEAAALLASCAGLLSILQSAVHNGQLTIGELAEVSAAAETVKRARAAT